MKNIDINPKLDFKYQYIWDKYTLSVCSLLALCVSLGTATVSLAKVLLLMGFVVQLVLDRKRLFKFRLSQAPYIFTWMLFAMIWMLISMVWSEASTLGMWKYYYGDTRFLWIGVIYYLIGTKDRALVVLKWMVIGQILVITISWLMWLGFEVPLTRKPIEKFIVFTSTLEQPVMTTLVLIILSELFDYFSKLLGRRLVLFIMIAMTLNITFLMSGRTGYVIFIIAFALWLFRVLPIRLRWFSLLSPFILSLLLYNISPVFTKRVSEIKINTSDYISKEKLSSEGERLDMWKHTLSAIAKNPILGYGIGSTPIVYRSEGGLISGELSQPHQQYLFWWLEFGLIGLLIMLVFFTSLMKDARLLDTDAKYSLYSVITVLFVMGMFNCPFFGVGMGEFFFLEIAALLAIRRPASNSDAATGRS